MKPPPRASNSRLATFLMCLSTATVVVATAPNGTAAVEPELPHVTSQVIWLHVPNMLEDRIFHASARLPDDRIIVMAGALGNYESNELGTTEIFDVSRGWVPGPAMPTIDNNSPENPTVAFTPGGHLLVVGGNEGRYQREGLLVRDLDMDQMTWTNRFVSIPGREPEIVINAAIVPVRDGIVVIGGTGMLPAPERSFLQARDSVCLISYQDWECTSLGTLLFPRTAPSAMLVGDKIIVTGGMVQTWNFCNPYSILGSAEEFDWVLRRSSRMPDMYESVAGHSMAELADGRIVLSGGGAGDYGSWQVFDPRLNKWTLRGRHLHRWYRRRLIPLNSGALIGVSGSAEDCCEVFVPDADQWVVVDKPAGMLHVGSAAEMADGNLLVTGVGAVNAAILDVNALSTAIAGVVSTVTPTAPATATQPPTASATPTAPRGRRIWLPFALRYRRAGTLAQAASGSCAQLHRRPRIEAAYGRPRVLTGCPRRCAPQYARH